jgi:hypothetical protein
MLKMQMKTITPTDATMYLVGPEGLVWVQPSIGDAQIVAANNEHDQEAAAAFIGALLDMGLVPYGVPVNQKVIVATFGGSPIRDCHWVTWSDAPAPTGEPGDTLPTQAGIVQ